MKSIYILLFFLLNLCANELSYETSPYLKQHASNPINWYAWGDKALEKAKKENKPIFLSIGYSTCHWCHIFWMTCVEGKDYFGRLLFKMCMIHASCFIHST